ncbi:hypothetical protein QLQ86_11205 [Halomonas sp. LR5S13]|uniref:hypothetical protein n=1 Tax=Halomonas rhizosphaerae TaxID=3043296 RepID=UPI0024A8FBB4|nr:hypothetical protein [Halomonas rhizosphaerae]MDI5921353.1 hypothetical protein [Halomonas rhizosphaerae]
MTLSFRRDKPFQQLLPLQRCRARRRYDSGFDSQEHLALLEQQRLAFAAMSALGREQSIMIPSA